jgi:hypothetical protein
MFDSWRRQNSREERRPVTEMVARQSTPKENAGDPIHHEMVHLERCLRAVAEPDRDEPAAVSEAAIGTALTSNPSL